jgi:flavin-dependent dehydrogenase
MQNPWGADLLIDRTQFARSLRTIALRVGVEWHEDRVTDIRQGARREFCLQTAQGMKHRCRALVIATGRAPFAPLRTNALKRLSPLLALYRTSPIMPNGSVTATFNLEAAEFGWWYRIEQSRQAQSVLVTTRDSLPRGQLQQEAWFPDGAQTCPHANDTRLSGPLITRPAGNQARFVPAGMGWVLAGDARIAVDPLSGQGVLKALEDGAAAARFALSSPAKTRRHAFARAHVEEFAAIDRTSRAYYLSQARHESAFWRQLAGR